MRQINTKKVLIVGFASILFLMMLTAVIAINQMRLTLNSIDHIVKENNTKTVLITTMLVTARERTISLQKMVRLSDPFDRDDEWMKFNGYGTSFANARQKFIKLGINEEEEFILKAQGLLTKNIAPMQIKIAQMAMDGNLKEAENLLNKNALPEQNKVFVQLYSLLNLIKENSNLTVQNVSNSLKISRQNIVIALAITIFIAMIISFMVTRRISATEIKLSREKQHAQVTLHSIGNAVITTDEKGRVTRMNPVAEKLTGWSFQEAEGLLLEAVFPVRNTSTHEPIENLIKKVTDINEKNSLSSHTTLIAKNGTEYQIDDSAAPITHDGRILGMVLVFNDVTEQYHLRKNLDKSKRDLQAIMDNSPTIIYVKDKQQHFTFINQQFEKRFNLRSKDIIGKNPRDILSKEIIAQMQNHDETALTAGHAIETEDIISHEGTPLTYASIRFPMFDEDDNIYAVCCMSTDITSRKLFEEQYRHTQKMEALGNITGGIAHDFNNMLGIVSGYAELLKQMLHDDQPKLAKYAHEIHHAGERGAKMTRKLLTFTQQKPCDEAILDFNSLLLNEQDMLEKTLTARVKLVLDLTENLWPVWLDHSDIEDLILNMSINAMHAIENNGQLSIQTLNQTIKKTEARSLALTPGDYVLLIITDTGSGMNKETKDKIFEPFFTTKGDKGTGLGLSQVYGFVNRSGGAISVYSEPGQGTKFVLYFPRYHDDTEQPEKSLKNNDTIKSIKGSETILLVDDEEALLSLNYEILEQHGFNVVTARNAKAALDILRNETIDLLISDIIMPEMDGCQLVSIVNEKYPNVKIQLVSGFAEDECQINIVNKALFKNLLYKPFNVQTLLQRVYDLLNDK